MPELVDYEVGTEVEPEEAGPPPSKRGKGSKAQVSAEASSAGVVKGPAATATAEKGMAKGPAAPAEKGVAKGPAAPAEKGVVKGPAAATAEKGGAPAGAAAERQAAPQHSRAQLAAQAGPGPGPSHAPGNPAPTLPYDLTMQQRCVCAWMLCVAAPVPRLGIYHFWGEGKGIVCYGRYRPRYTL